MGPMHWVGCGCFSLGDGGGEEDRPMYEYWCDERL
jgi:hypothetical protein